MTDAVDHRRLPLTERHEIAKHGPTLILDGSCGLCSTSAAKLFQYSPTPAPFYVMWGQHADTLPLLKEYGISQEDIMASWAVVENGNITRGADAWLRAASLLRYPYCLVTPLGRLVPKFIRDVAYDFVARNRQTISTSRVFVYLFGGKGDKVICRRPTKAMMGRYLHDTTDLPKS